MPINVNVNWDDDAASRFVEQATAKAAAAYQAVLDDLLARFSGHPVDEIKPVLASEWASVADGHIADPELTEWSTHLSNGTRIEFRPSAGSGG